MKTTTKLFSLLLFSILFSLASCSKDGDAGSSDDRQQEQDDQDQQQPQSKAETEQKIQGKWNISGSTDIQSIEFVGSDTYVLGVSATSPLIASSSSPRNTVSTGLKATDGRLKAEGSNASGTVFLAGTYQISADGKTITLELEDLEEKIIITVNNLSDQAFSFTVKIGDGAAIEVSSTAAATVAVSDKTTLLTRTWGAIDWLGTFEQDEINLLTAAGYTPKDVVILTFTRSETCIMTIRGAGRNPETNTPEFYQYSNVGTWEWKNSEQNILLIKSYDEYEDRMFTEEVPVFELTNDKLEVPIGDNPRVAMSPR